MFVKITNGQVDKFPYTVGDLRKDNPNISFPRNVDDESMQRFGVYRVVEKPAQADYNPRTHRLVTPNPVLIDGVWTVTDILVAKTQEQIDSENTQKAKSVREQRNRLIAECDWTQVLDAPVDRNVWSIYRQLLRDIPGQEGFPWDVQWPAKPE